jgi:hypothetical protein
MPCRGNSEKVPERCPTSEGVPGVIVLRAAMSESEGPLELGGLRDARGRHVLAGQLSANQTRIAAPRLLLGACRPSGCLAKFPSLVSCSVDLKGPRRECAITYGPMQRSVDVRPIRPVLSFRARMLRFPTQLGRFG